MSIAASLLFGIGVLCRSLAEERAPVRSLLEIREEKVIRQNWDLSCGAAALATLLNFQHGERLTERTVAKGLIN
ncbi:MAG: hypothetical protein AAGA22_08720, partial [Pseudomonadota bacterium]